jgi:hypothetical protein
MRDGNFPYQLRNYTPSSLSLLVVVLSVLVPFAKAAEQNHIELIGHEYASILFVQVVAQAPQRPSLVKSHRLPLSTA